MPETTISYINIKDSFMKKVLLLSLTLLLCVSVSFSQFGIKGGINLGTFGGDDKSIDPAFFDAALAGLAKIDPTPRMGIAGGITYKVGFIAGLSIEPGVMYIQRGAVYELTLPAALGGGSGKMTWKLDYIEIPVLVKFALPIPVISPYIEGGVSYGFLASAKMKFEGGGGSSEGDIKDGMNKSNISALVGVGVELAMLDVNARYALGISKIDKDGNAKLYNRGIMLTVGLRF
jgi:hypothetical protein